MRDITEELDKVDDEIKQARIAFLDAEAAWEIEKKRLRQVWNDLMESRGELIAKSRTQDPK